jgi:hypothetical protein
MVSIASFLMRFHSSVGLSKRDGCGTPSFWGAVGSNASTSARQGSKPDRRITGTSFGTLKMRISLSSHREREREERESQMQRAYRASAAQAPHKTPPLFSSSTFVNLSAHPLCVAHVTAEGSSINVAMRSTRAAI